MKKKARYISIVLALTLCLAPITQVSALAYDSSAAGAVAVAGAMGVENIYESTVIARMSGRAGAATANGAKGISFEIIYSDVKNIFHNFKDGLKTNLSASSIDDVADLVTTNKAGDIIQLIQCKDGGSESQFYKMIRQVGSGKYSSAELVCTQELASRFNDKAPSKGISQKATDSGISTKTTTRIANKALGITPSGSELFKSSVKNASVAAAITACISLAESIYRGDDVYATTANLVEDTAISAVSITLATISSAELPALLTALGASAAVANTAAAVVAFLVPVAGGYALYILADKCQFDETLADTLEEVVNAITDTYSKVEAKVVSLDIPAKTASVWEFVDVHVTSLVSTMKSWYIKIESDVGK